MKWLIVPMMSGLILSGCVNGYRDFYHPYVDATTLQDVEILSSAEEPKIYNIPIQDMERATKDLRAKGYEPIGYSSFNGILQRPSLLVGQAKRVRAKVVLVGSQFTNSQQSTYVLPMPSSSTTNASGNVYGNWGSANYSGSSTTYGTTYVPVTTAQNRFDQQAIYFVKITKKLRFGMSLIDVPADVRARIGRNTGAVVNIVREGTPAFNSNVIEGDVIIEIDGSQIRNAAHASEVMAGTSPDASKSVFKLLRNGEEKEIHLDLR